MGLASYYRRFVPGFAALADALHHLLNKGERYNWTDEWEDAFRKLQKRLLSIPILAYPNSKKPFIIHVDASGTEIGGVVNQIQDGHERVIANYSRLLTKIERRSKFCSNEW